MYAIRSYYVLYYMLVKMNEVLSGIVVNKANISRNLKATHGLIYSQRVLLKLVEKGITREVAYKVVQDNAMKSWNTGQEFKDFVITSYSIHYTKLYESTTASSKARAMSALSFITLGSAGSFSAGRFCLSVVSPFF